MRFHGGQVDDVLADEALGNEEAVGINLVEAEELIRDRAYGVTDVDPGLVSFIEMDVAQPMGLDHVELLVFPLAEMGVDHHRAVMACMDVRGGIPVALHGPDDPVQLPGGGGTGGIEEVPADVHLEGGIRLLGDDLLIAGEVHQTVIIIQHGGRRGPDNGNFRFTHDDKIQTSESEVESRDF